MENYEFLKKLKGQKNRLLIQRNHSKIHCIAEQHPELFQEFFPSNYVNCGKNFDFEEEFDPAKIRPSCLGCYTYFIKGESLRNIKYSSRTIFCNGQKMLNQKIAELICGQLNLGGGYILMAPFANIDDQQIYAGYPNRVQALQVWKKRKELIEEYIQPFPGQIELDCVPFLEDENDLSGQDYIVRIKCIADEKKRSFYLEKNRLNKFYRFDEENRSVKEVNVTKIYKFIQKNIPRKLTYMRHIESVECQEIPENYLSLEEEDQNLEGEQIFVSRLEVENQLNETIRSIGKERRVWLLRKPEFVSEDLFLSAVKFQMINFSNQYQIKEFPPLFQKYCRRGSNKQNQQKYHYYLLFSDLSEVCVPLLNSSLIKQLNQKFKNSATFQSVMLPFSTSIKLSKMISTQQIQFFKESIDFFKNKAMILFQETSSLNIKSNCQICIGTDNGKNQQKIQLWYLYVCLQLMELRPYISI